MATKVKGLNLGLGVDLLGNKLSLASSERTGTTIETCDIEELKRHGFVCTSGKNGRVIFIPFANCKGAEIQMAASEVLDLNKKKK